MLPMAGEGVQGLERDFKILAYDIQGMWPHVRSPAMRCGR